MSLTIGIDQSKRSTAIVVLKEDGGVDQFRLICPIACMDGVELIDYQWECLTEFISSRYQIYNHRMEEYEELPITQAVIEGLSFAAVGSGKDLLAALNWMYRWQLQSEYHLYLGPVPVSAWRSRVLTKEEQKAAKADGKDGLKKAVVAKLPGNVRGNFQNYVEGNKDYILQAKDKDWKKGSKSKKYQEAMYDLADAYWLARYRQII